MAKKGMSMNKGAPMKSGGVMKNHGNTSSIETTNAQKYDLGRVQWCSYEKQGYPPKAFAYEW